MSNKPMKAAHSRHMPGSHPKNCPICNPKKSQKYEAVQLGRKATKINLKQGERNEQ